MNNRLAALLIVLATAITACANGSDNIFDATTNPTEPPTTTTFTNELDQVQTEPTTNNPAPTSPQLAVETFFNAADAYFASPDSTTTQLDTIASQAAAAVVADEHDANINRADADRINQLEAIESSVHNLEIAPAGTSSIATACVERVGTNQAAGTITRWLTVELTLTMTQSTWVVDQYQITQDDTLLGGPSCVPAYATQRAVTLLTTANQLLDRAQRDPFVPQAELVTVFGDTALQEVQTNIEMQQELNLALDSPFEFRIEEGAQGNPEILGQAVTLEVCHLYSQGASFVDIDNPSQTIRSAFNPDTSRQFGFTVRIGQQPSDDRMVAIDFRGEQCW